MKSMILATILLIGSQLFSQPYLGNGIKIGEVDASSAIVWARLTAVQAGDSQAKTQPAPGVQGNVSIAYRVAGSDSRWTNHVLSSVEPDSDFTIQLKLEDLDAGQRYEVKVDALSSRGEITDSVEGSFRMALGADDTSGVTGVVVTCQGIGTVDDPVFGHKAYDVMLSHQPDFFVHTGDVVYYDKDYDGMQPLSKNKTQARERWNRMFSYDWNKRFSSLVSSYFMKDDHDTLKNDCWIGQKYGDLTFEEGLALFREQVPSGPLPYRTVRWGADLQIWMLEGRDYRSPNRNPDGPAKTILGKEQKAWLKRTILESDATFKLVISPSPIVGPDKKGKNDNLSNANFQTEGLEVRDFLAGIKNLYVVCGDRHWQYASKDAETGLMEMGCGPINDEHAKIGGNSGRQREHIYFGGGFGGYLLFEVNRQGERPRIDFKWMATDCSGSKSEEDRINFRMTFLAE